MAATPWGHLQHNPGKSLEDFKVHNFLKKFGIEYTSKCVKTPTLIGVERLGNNKLVSLFSKRIL